MFALLIVEDDDDLRDALATYLKIEGYEVLEAKDGVDGINLCKERCPDLVISDIRMPRMDGIQLLKALQKMDCPAPPVILVSAFADIGRDEAISLGAHDLLPKPIDLNSFLPVLEKIKAARESKAV